MTRTATPPFSFRPSVGEVLSVELAADEHVQWIWSYHGQRGCSVIGYTVVPREPLEVPRARPIGFFPLEENARSR